jgi:hypothetical protein
MNFRGNFIQLVLKIVDLEVSVCLLLSLIVVEVRWCCEAVEAALFFQLLEGVVGYLLEFRLAVGLDRHLFALMISRD